MCLATAEATLSSGATTVFVAALPSREGHARKYSSIAGEISDGSFVRGAFSYTASTASEESIPGTRCGTVGDSMTLGLRL